jgi:hypothetical protein
MGSCIDQSHQISVNVNIYNADNDAITPERKKKNFSASFGSNSPKRNKNLYRSKSGAGSQEIHSNALDEKADIQVHDKMAKTFMEEELGKSRSKGEVMIKALSSIKKNSVSPYHSNRKLSGGHSNRKDSNPRSTLDPESRKNSFHSLHSQSSIRSTGFLELLGILPVEKSMTWSSRSDMMGEKTPDDIEKDYNSLSDCYEEDESKKSSDAKFSFEDKKLLDVAVELDLAARLQETELPDNTPRSLPESPA